MKMLLIFNFCRWGIPARFQREHRLSLFLRPPWWNVSLSGRVEHYCLTTTSTATSIEDGRTKNQIVVKGLIAECHPGFMQPRWVLWASRSLYIAANPLAMWLAVMSFVAFISPNVANLYMAFHSIYGTLISLSRCQRRRLSVAARSPASSTPVR